MRDILGGVQQICRPWPFHGHAAQWRFWLPRPPNPLASQAAVLRRAIKKCGREPLEATVRTVQAQRNLEQVICINARERKKIHNSTGSERFGSPELTFTNASAGPPNSTALGPITSHTTTPTSTPRNENRGCACAWKPCWGAVLLVWVSNQEATQNHDRPAICVCAKCCKCPQSPNALSADEDAMTTKTPLVEGNLSPKFQECMAVVDRGRFQYYFILSCVCGPCKTTVGQTMLQVCPPARKVILALLSVSYVEGKKLAASQKKNLRTWVSDFWWSLACPFSRACKCQ